MENKVLISSDYITLGQFLKYENIVESGGLVKEFLNTEVIYVNGVSENRRGKKLYHGDIVKIEGIGEYTILNDQN